MMSMDAPLGIAMMLPLLVMVTLCAMTDIWTHRIPNMILWPALTLTLFANGLLAGLPGVLDSSLGLFFGLAILIVGPVSLSTIGKARSGLVPTYVGLGLIFAAAISNEGENALFGHATDFLFIQSVGIANLADGMVLIGFILVLLTSTYQKLISHPTNSIDNPPPKGC